ncbi:hypothetical protein Pryu01_00514 [Paraliobacillus ryukyuensis]|uniref:YqzE-like protein n=1 Tax=Paraliobacillus ryukyuensis TaxID=200904 RepID=A0A366EGF6_9BACI|nr:YqzE family protein [Paraliobacillus ryukyuensis]RBP01413.1 YqzE-like protein [Paraliobacillus ryukyuensis]
MSGNDLVKYVTKELVKYADMTKEEKERMREQRKAEKQQAQFYLSNKWFGLLPFSIRTWANKKRKNRSL